LSTALSGGRVWATFHLGARATLTIAAGLVDFTFLGKHGIPIAEVKRFPADRPMGMKAEIRISNVSTIGSQRETRPPSRVNPRSSFA
jgi:hypothetical protein